MRQTRKIDDPQLFHQVKDFVNQRLAAAQSLGATWDIDELESVAFTLSGADDSIRVVVGDRITLYFCNDQQPGYIYSLYRDGTLLEHVGDSPSDLREKMELASRLAIGLPEQAYYGWVEDDVVTTMIMSGRMKRAKVPGLFCAVLKGTTLPRQLRMPVDASEQDIEEWLSRFWAFVKQGKIVRLGARIKALPGEFWVVCKDRRAHFRFDATDDQLPRLVPQMPYHQQHPREEYPGELNLIRWPDCKNPLRSIVI